jgi:tetratricopeptide (TPR) repeat protein
LSPGIPALWAEWASVDAERRRFEEALDKLRRAIDLDNRYFDAWLLRGHLRALQGQHAEALAAYDQALERKARDVAALRGRAIALAELSRPAESMTTLDTLLAIVPDDAVALRLRTQLQNAQ